MWTMLCPPTTISVVRTSIRRPLHATCEIVREHWSVTQLRASNLGIRWCSKLFRWEPEGHSIREAHVTVGKKKKKKTLFFVVVAVYTRQQMNAITFWVFGTKSASHTCVLVSGAHARLLSTIDRTRVVRITSRAAVGWFRWMVTYHVTKNPNNTGEIGASVYNFGKPNHVKLFSPSFKKSRCGGENFRPRFFFSV